MLLHQEIDFPSRLDLQISQFPAHAYRSSTSPKQSIQSPRLHPRSSFMECPFRYTPSHRLYQKLRFWKENCLYTLFIGFPILSTPTIYFSIIILLIYLLAKRSSFLICSIQMTTMAAYDIFYSMRNKCDIFSVYFLFAYFAYVMQWLTHTYLCDTLSFIQ